MVREWDCNNAHTCHTLRPGGSQPGGAPDVCQPVVACVLHCHRRQQSFTLDNGLVPAHPAGPCAASVLQEGAEGMEWLFGVCMGLTRKFALGTFVLPGL